MSRGISRPPRFLLPQESVEQELVGTKQQQEHSFAQEFIANPNFFGSGFSCPPKQPEELVGTKKHQEHSFGQELAAHTSAQISKLENIKKFLLLRN